MGSFLGSEHSTALLDSVLLLASAQFKLMYKVMVTFKEIKKLKKGFILDQNDLIVYLLFH